ncbi:MAG: GAF domain-containing protein, partial [Niallia sp.]
MENQQIYLFLCKKFEKIPFRIYYFQNLNKHAQLIYSSGEMNKFALPAFSAPGEEKYLIQSDSEKMLITFFYSGNTQILFFLANPNLALSEEDLESMYIIFSVLRIENKMKTKEAELASMIDSIRLITSILELEEVLNNIITQALSVISAADAGHLQLYDEKTKELIPRAAVGFNEKIQWIRIKSGESFTGKVYRDRTPVIYYSRSEVYDNMTNISSENSGYIQDSIDSSKLKSLISVPLLLENKVIGVMTVLQYDSEGQLSENDLNLLHGFAAQAAIAIYNAELYQNATERLEEIAKIKSRLEEKNKLLLRRA